MSATRRRRRHNSTMRTSSRLLAALGLAFAVATGCGAEECTTHADIHNYYRELDCLPVLEDGASCPSRYDCSVGMDSRDPDKCYRNGKVYESGTEVPTLPDACQFSCRCESGSVNCNGVVDCFQFPGGIPEGCQPKYEEGKCCPTGLNCVNGTDPDAFKCQYGAKTYVLDQYIIQNDKPCQQCKCKEGFDGTLSGPWCSPVDCALDFRYKGNERCAPIFNASPERCCVRSWRCPTDADTVVPAASSKPASAGQCTFGTLTLNLGDALSASLVQSESCAECTCVVPPYVTCKLTKDWCS